MTTTTALRDSDHWIRPWYPSGTLGHLYPDCERLLRHMSDPQEGAGWLDPRKPDVCRACLERYNPDTAEPPSWDAFCDTCHTSMAEELDNADGPFTEKDARDWRDDHRCEPSIRLIAPDKPARSAA